MDSETSPNGSGNFPERARKPIYLPTVEEIAAKTAKIRRGWDDREYRLRAGLEPDVPPVRIPIVREPMD